MKVAFRLDASQTQGVGHLVRCLVLADAIAAQGGQCVFILKHMDEAAQRAWGNSAHDIRTLALAAKSGWAADAAATRENLPEQIDWLICDHYGLDARWEKALGDAARQLLVIDDLANRPHSCHALVDPGLTRTALDYHPWMEVPARLMLGTQYALLKPAYATLHNAAPVWPSVSKAHLFFGGGAQAAWLPLYAERLLMAQPGLKVHAIGQADAHSMLALNQRFKQRLDWTPYVDNMALTYTECDLAFGSPGTATWERACVGLPSGLIATADNQVPILESLDRQGFCRYLGEAQRLDTSTFEHALNTFLNDQTSLTAMRSMGVKSVDGLGVQRIVSAMISMSCQHA
jgi:UDP-2,4-diacetamido-2,4,6-trideoxy-beta-L-altropyranose hydrolase